MRIPVEWLGEYVDIKEVSAEKLSEVLTLSGTENEILKSEGGFEGIVVGEVKKLEKHPDADKLSICNVDVGLTSSVIPSETEESLKETKGKGSLRSQKASVEMTERGELQIVCSAPNLEVGQKVPVALPGAKIGEFEIKEVEMRGVKSEGMLCSESELGISDDHTGIMILDPRSKVGESLDKAFGAGGIVIDAELTPNRGDCFSIIGIARETATALSSTLLRAGGAKLKHIDFKKPEIKSKKKVEVKVKDKELCPRYIAKVVEGVKIGPSPKWMQDRLSAAGIRPINNIVDVTNYVMFEWGQPLHAFDAAKLHADQRGIKRGLTQIIVRRAKVGEKIQTLDGIDRKLTTSDLIIADSKKPIAVAGVMGGANSEVLDKTRTIVLEAAVFDKTSVRKTAQRLGLRSEASNRFEKGIPLGLPEIAIERAAQLIVEIADSRGLKETQISADKTKSKIEKSVLSESRTDRKSKIIRVGPNVDVFSAWIWTQHVGMRLSRAEKFLGVKIPIEHQIKILRPLGFEAERFDFKAEARKHVGKPYVWGAKFKTHGDMAFDCSYLTDYIYSQIGEFIGYTSLAQYEMGKPVKKNDLKPGDILFVKGHIDQSATDHYFVPDDHEGYRKVKLTEKKEIGHNGIYIGDGRVVHARHYEYDKKTGKWIKNSKEGKVVEEDVDVYLSNPEYIGARRYIDDPNDWLSITVPWWRLDVSIEEDIFEEIARIYGYDKFPSTLPVGELPKVEENKKLKLVSDVKNILAGAGFSEVYSYSFVSAKMLSETGTLVEKVLRIANPISPEQEYMRTNLIGSLLSNAAKNQDNFEDIAAFEIASCYLSVRGEDLPREVPTLGVLVKSKKDGEGFSRLKGILELLSEKLNLPDFELSREEGRTFEKGRLATVSQYGEKIGIIGEISNRTKLVFSLKNDFAILHINIRKLVDLYGTPKKYQQISKYPTPVRDMSALFGKQVTADKISGAISGAKIDYLKSFAITDIYEGKPLPEGQKNVTIRLVFGSDEKTLTESEIENSRAKVLEIIKKTGGTLRV